MRYFWKVACTFGIIATIAAAASAADARGYHRSAPDAYNGAYDASGGAFERPARSSIPYDAGGVAYGQGQRDLDGSSDFQLQGR